MATADPTDLKRLVGDAPIILLDGGYSSLAPGKLEFISPSRLFTDLNYSAPPFAVSTVTRTSPQQRKRTRRIRELNAREDTCAWLTRASSGPLTWQYKLSDIELSFARVKLHALLDCPRTPSLELLVAWITELRDQAEVSVLGCTRSHASLM